jgi:hypothetical protein
MKSVLVVLMALMSANVFAQSATSDQNSSTVNAKDVEPSKVEGKADIDDEITNARLRAVTGAKSNFSFWSQFVYSGASIVNPLSSQRPQLNSQNNADPTNLYGQVSGKYRLSEHDSIIAGIGVQYTPAYTDNTQGPQGASTTAQSPYIDYNRAFRTGQFQNVVDVSISKYTLAADLANNLNWSWGVQHQLMRELGESKKLSLGLASFIGQDVYTAAGQPAGSYYLQVQVEPIMEYAITDKVSFRTVYRMLILNEMATTNANWQQATQTESAGVGFAITRDIYIYPNMQWIWNHISADATTVGFSTNINL